MTAKTSTRDVYKNAGAYNVDGERSRVHVGVETVRSATCPLHTRESTDFQGVADARWVFHCKGGGQPDTSHYFTDEPV